MFPSSRDDTLLASSVLFSVHYKNQEFVIDAEAEADFMQLDNQVESVLSSSLAHTPNVIIVTNAEVCIFRPFVHHT